MIAKIGFSIFSLLFSFLLFSQEQTVTVIGSGDGVNITAATNQALRNCIEKSMGAFLSSSTVISNDELVKDEIVTIASGNIVSYQILSELNLKDNYNVTVSAIISPEQLITTLKAKGFNFELNGGVYAQNILKEKFYAEQEKVAIQNFIKTWEKVQLFDFDIKMTEPVAFKKRVDPNYGNEEVKILDNNLLYTLREPFKTGITTIYNSYLANSIDFKEGKFPSEPEIGLISAYDYSKRINISENSTTLPGSYKNMEYLMFAVFSPKISQQYISFLNSFMNLMSSISIKDVNSYKTLNPEFMKVNVTSKYIQSFPGLDLANLPVNEVGNICFYLRNKENEKLLLNLSEVIKMKSTALNFTSNIFSTEPVFLSEPSGINQNWYKFSFINPIYYDALSFPGERHPSTETGFRPTVYMMLFSFEELQNLKKIDFKLKEK
jgi:hypothetical protein